MNHCDEVLALLRTQVSNPGEVNEIRETARKVADKWVDPVSGGAEETNGLIYGLVQSGKTGVLTVTGAIGADEGYRTIIILTSDIDPLYEQTLARVREAFPGIDILGKSDLRDAQSFLRRIKAGTTAIVVTKNSGILQTLLDNLTVGRVRGLSCLVIDDEADQASLNTRSTRNDGSQSAINRLITDIRGFFQKNTYLQVTATPQALFLQPSEHAFRPKFTVLSHPGADYVGGNDFFSEGSPLVKEFPLQEIIALSPGSQPSPSGAIPRSLLTALDTFMVGATYKRSRNANENCAFLCHVSTRKDDHRYIVNLLFKYKQDLASGLATENARVIGRLRAAYDDLASTHAGIRGSSFDDLIERIKFFSPGIAVKLVNGETDEDVAVRSPYNLFVGGNKLGRGVTIKNLLVSYYGRNPRAPQADTVLQHARMYGYRRKDLGLLRLFLPPQLHTVFRAINRMENGLRELIASKRSEEFRGIYVSGGVRPTRRSVLVPGAVGVYTAGGSYNPSQVLRTPDNHRSTVKLDQHLAAVQNKSYVELPIENLQELIDLVRPDPASSEAVWDGAAIKGSIEQWAKLSGQRKAYVYVDRDRDLKEGRRETQGVLTGGEARSVPSDRVTLFILRTKQNRNQEPAWWPQIRFPDGAYAFAFAI